MFLEPEELELLRWLGHMPLASVRDLVGLEVMSQAALYKVLPDLESRGLVAHIEIGMTMTRRKRWYLTRSGVRRAFALDHRHADTHAKKALESLSVWDPEWRQIYARYEWGHNHDYTPAPSGTGRSAGERVDIGHDHVPWTATRSGLETLLSRVRIPMLEQTYALAPTLLRSAEVSDDVASERKMTVFHWIRTNSAVHAVARYGDWVWIPFVWVGVEVTRSALAKKWEHWWRGLHYFSMSEATYSEYDAYWENRPWSEPDPTPVVSGWVIVAMDMMAFTVARQVIAPGSSIFRKCVIVENHVEYTEGELRISKDFIWDPPRSEVIGLPEDIAEWIKDHDHAWWRALNSTLATRIFGCIEQWPAMRVSQIAQMVRESNRKTKEALDPLVAAGLVVQLEKRFYMASGGMTRAAYRDRISVGTINRRLGQYLAPDGRYRRRNVRHNGGVNRLAVSFTKDWLPVAGGWRGIFNVPGVTQLAPDLMVLLREGPFGFGWHYVEYERTAVAPQQILTKTRPYRLFAHEGYPRPLIVVTEREAAEAAFVRACPDLPMLTSTLDRAAKGFVLDIPGIWRYRGDPVVLPSFDPTSSEAEDEIEDYRPERQGSVTITTVPPQF